MAMKMLDAGGMPVAHRRHPDGRRQQPEGLLRARAVKELDKKRRHARGSSDARGKAVKIISFLLTWLPETYDYRVIFMQRDLAR